MVLVQHDLSPAAAGVLRRASYRDQEVTIYENISLTISQQIYQFMKDLGFRYLRKNNRYRLVQNDIAPTAKPTTTAAAVVLAHLPSNFEALDDAAIAELIWASGIDDGKSKNVLVASGEIPLVTAVAQYVKAPTVVGNNRFGETELLAAMGAFKGYVIDDLFLMCAPNPRFDVVISGAQVTAPEAYRYARLSYDCLKPRGIAIVAMPVNAYYAKTSDGKTFRDWVKETGSNVSRISDSVACLTLQN